MKRPLIDLDYPAASPAAARKLKDFRETFKDDENFNPEYSLGDSFDAPANELPPYNFTGETETKTERMRKGN